MIISLRFLFFLYYLYIWGFILIKTKINIILNWAIKFILLKKRIFKNLKKWILGKSKNNRNKNNQNNQDKKHKKLDKLGLKEDKNKVKFNSKVLIN